MDVACGAGRNALFLASRGFSVDAVDISRVALARGRADAGDLPVRWIECDLDDGFEPDYRYDVIVNIRYVNLPLVSTLIEWLRPGGVLILEQHLESGDDAIGPRNPAYRVGRGTLGRLVAGMIVEYIQEGVIEDPDGRRAALARLVARKGSAAS